MLIAGVDVAAHHVVELADLLIHAGHNEVAALLLIANAAGDQRVDLTIAERGVILAVLTDPPDGLLKLRASLLVGRNRKTLA